MSNHYLSFATILLPRPGTDLSRYSVIACDQFTSQPDYWQKVRDYVGNTPSTLGMILPEIYLAQPDAKERIQRIHRTMERYQAEGVFVPLRHAMVCVRRTLSDGSLRRGIVGLIDLEQYDYRPGSDSLIRATEQTVLERLPPRMEIRQGAPLELPHVMLLVDDEQEPLIQPICDEYQQMEPLYDFDLMLGSGHLSGYRLDDASAQRLTAGLEKLADPEVFSKRYGISGRTPLLFAVGDGNHSLAAARACWERIKHTLPPEQAAAHPARYALAEVCSLHDPSLQFRAIHRVVFDVNPTQLMSALKHRYHILPGVHPQGQTITALWRDQEEVFTILDPPCQLATGSLQQFLDGYLRVHRGREDYIHGRETVRTLAAQPDTIGFLLPAMEKSMLFKTVVLDGALPRKTFSMGQALDKRFYLEARRIQPQSL